MSKLITLNKTVQYSKKRIKSENVTIENFISTDNILQNKLGITKATNLPPNGQAMPSYFEEDILVANIRPYLKKIWFADKNGGCSSDVLVFETKKGYFPKFIYYNLFRDDFFDFVMKGSKGTKMPRGDKNQILNYLIPDFELSTQQKIAKVLSDLDTKIELNNKINAELEAMAKTLYDYWFVQFDFPYSPPSEGCPQDGVGIGKPYKSSGGKMVWNEELKREIPEGWEVKTVEDYAEVKKGDLITARDSKQGLVKVVAAGINYSYLHSVSNRQKNTITISGSGANAGFINFWREPIFASDCITVRGENDTITLMILHHLRLLQDYILSQATGSAQPHVYPSDIKILNYVIPLNHLIEQFGKIVLPMNDKISNNLKENQELSTLRDWLLPMLMNGQVTVGAVEEQLGMVAESGEKYE